MLSNSLRKKINRGLRVFHTIKHLQLRQAWYFFLRRGIGARLVKSYAADIVCRNVVIHPILELTHSEGDYSAYEFNFLNRVLSFQRDAMSWCPLETQRLWRYNLHYFDFLRDPTRPLQQKTALIDDWITNNPQGSEPAWEPYTTSLRIVNWCLFFWSLPQDQITAAWLSSLHMQARWLERNLELHILANHYFENIKAMLFASLYFNDSYSTRWLSHFQKELAVQLREQMLSDGGHYERSPQYHSILLEDFLDLYAMFSTNPTLVQTETFASLIHAIKGALHVLSLIATPDDDIPLFNDSASGAASPPSTIFAKANALGFDAKIESCALIDLSASGLFGWKSEQDYFLIDCGDIGPDYQPGHTHCDFLSFILMLNGQWLVVDSGVCEYEPGPMRQYARSTAAHNTVCIDDQEQSEIWSEFRVGRRARSLGASIKREGNSIIFEGGYTGFPTLTANIVHRRRMVLTLDTTGSIMSVDVSDRLEGNNEAVRNIQTLLHLHPILHAESLSNQKSLVIKRANTMVSTIHSPQTITIRPNVSWFCPEFGLKQANQALQLQTLSTLPANFSYRLTANRID